MTPYSGQGIQENQAIFNYRLSRARRVIENAFGVLVARRRVFVHPIQTTVNYAEIVVKVTICVIFYVKQTVLVIVLLVL